MSRHNKSIIPDKMLFVGLMIVIMKKNSNSGKPEE